jgi:uncharacterized protein (DUF1778 family)
MVDKKKKLAKNPGQHAVDAVLDQKLFVLDADQHDAFVRVLDNPPSPNNVLKELMARKSPWENRLS